jgi:hypothetical protein
VPRAPSTVVYSVQTCRSTSAAKGAPGPTTVVWHVSAIQIPAEVRRLMVGEAPPCIRSLGVTARRKACKSTNTRQIRRASCKLPTFKVDISYPTNMTTVHRPSRVHGERCGATAVLACRWVGSDHRLCNFCSSSTDFLRFSSSSQFSALGGVQE